MTGWVTLRGNTRPEATPANDRGRVDDDSPMNHMVLLLQRAPEQEQDLEQFINDLHDPASPQFHHWITAEEFGRRFGVPWQDVSRVTDWLESQGFQVNLVYPNRILIDFSGSAGQVRQAFHTEIHHLRVKDESHIANLSDPMIPAQLAASIAGVVYLNDFRPQPMNVPRSEYNAGSGYELVVPADLATIYNLNPAFAAGIAGQGQTIVLIEATDLYTTADWTAFRSTLGLASMYPSATLTTVHPSSTANNCTDPGVNGDDAEAALDVEWASAAAPNAALEVASCNEGLLVPLQNLLNASSTPPAIVSISYGGSETYQGASTNAYNNSLYQQAAAEGVSVFVSSGDSGAALSGYESGINVSGLTSTPYNVSVGGTDFADTYQGAKATYWNSANDVNYGSALSYVPEIPWNDSCASALIADYQGLFPGYGTGGLCNSGQYLNITAGSGGPSGCATGAPATSGVVSGTCAGYAKPPWQSGIVGNPKDGVRDVPDVALFAANGIWEHYYVVCYSDPSYGGRSCSGLPSTWAGFGGTSVSTPIMAGIQALANQVSGARWGNPNPTYYSLARSEYGSGGNSACVSSLGNKVAANCVFYDVRQIPLLYTGTGTGADMDVFCSGENCYVPSGTYGVLSAAPQALTSAEVTDLGSGYTSAPTCALSGGGGTGATCSGEITGVVSSITLTNGGSGFDLYGSPVCSLTGGGGTGAQCVAYLCSNTAVCEVSVTNHGKGYTSAPKCSIARDYGGGATCTAAIASGIAITLTAPGSGYKSLPNCVLSGGGGTGGICAVQAINSSDAYQPAFAAGTGWDFATGIGTVNASNLVASFSPSAASFNPTSLTFSSQPLNSTSAAQTVTVTNSGTANLAILTVTLNGTNAGNFTKTGDTCSGVKVLPSHTCTVSVNFTPITAGAKSASLAFMDIAPHNPQTVSIAGTGANSPAAATPKFSPSPGTYTSPQTVSIADGTAGAVIFYTIDGTTPTMASTVYTTPLIVDSVETVKAIAVATGFAISAVGTANYTVNITPTFATLASFAGTNGASPHAGLVQGIDGNFYGTTAGGGNNITACGTAYNSSCGTVFKVSPSGTLSSFHSFCAKTNCTDGSVPYGSLVQDLTGNFYGTTSAGGTSTNCIAEDGYGSGCGTVFKMTSAGTLTNLHSFVSTDGSYPQAGLVLATDGNLYGTTENGGNDYGTVFKTTVAGAFTSLHSFDYSDGAYPYAPLVQGAGGNFYGTTIYGGIGDGTVFTITPAGSLTGLHNFDNTDGYVPYAGLVQASNGNFYGTTYEGGANDFGTVFAMTPAGTVTTLYNFCTQTNCADGSYPYAPLTVGTDGNFYGTTAYGGTDYGTVFKLTPAGKLVTLHSFDYSDGAYPYAGLIQATDGNFYGTTLEGGANEDGTVFKLGVGLGPFAITEPASGAVGATVLILGNNLTGSTALSFNGTAATFTVVSSSEIKTTVPTGATTGFVQVTTPSGTLKSNVAFQVTAH
jgi:uncharacterized repeat protein (TIGR03803 family)